MNFRYKAALCAAVMLSATEAQAANFLIVDIVAKGVGRGSTGSRPGTSPIQSYTFDSFYTTLSYNLDGPFGPTAGSSGTSVTGSLSSPSVRGAFTATTFNFAAIIQQSFVSLNLTGSACYANPQTSITFGSPALNSACSPFKVSYSDGFAVAGYEFIGNVTGINFRTVEADVLPAITFAIPEPSTWALMLAGFGMVGYAMRRRRQSVAFA